jgi:hypothetical protein
MGVETMAILSYIAIAASVASAAMKLMDSPSGKEADMRKEQLDIMAQDRELEKQRNQARLEREARAKRAAIVNNSGAKGAGNSSAAQGAIMGISAAQQREQNYLDQKSALAAQSDAVTRSQIDLDASNKRSNEITDSLGTLAEGGMKLGGLTDIFSTQTFGPYGGEAPM